VFDVETQAVASLTFELMGRPNVHVRYERATATHGEAMQTNAVYGSHGFMNWNWLPFGQDLKLSIRRTTGPNAAEVEVIPADADQSPNWKLEPIMQFRAFLQGQTDAIGMFDARALHALRIIRAVYDSAETGRPVRIQLDEPRPAALSPM
jgi:predicted dehydrogenase